MSAAIDLDAIAESLKSARDDGRAIAPITDSVEGFDLDMAYEVSRRIHEARLVEGAVPVGRKIGFTNSAIWPVYGVHAPVWGYLYDTTVVNAGDGRLTYSLGGLCEPKIEPEIVLHFAETPPVDGDLDAIVACIDWVAHAFEIVQCHYPGWKFQAADAVANSALHGGLLLGEPLAIERLGADPVATLESFSVTLSRDGEEVETGKGSNVLGGPVAAVAHLIADLGERRSPPLESGEMVTTGTLTAAYPVQAGQRWSTSLAGIALDGLSVEL
jgi:2-keto-4-pentenoate hydratase